MWFVMSLSALIPKHNKLMGHHSYKLFQGAPGSDRMAYLLPFRKCEHECGMVVKGFVKRSCCKDSRSGATVSRCAPSVL